ncbi:MAG: hypothetical protein AAF958_08990 [Planctomycetota bacterium]
MMQTLQTRPQRSSPNRSQVFGLIALFAVLVSCGCRGGWWQPPGPLNRQRASAVIHDPFPQNDIAPFDAALRPPDYQQPLPEPVRNTIGRQYRGSF